MGAARILQNAMRVYQEVPVWSNCMENFNLGMTEDWTDGEVDIEGGVGGVHTGIASVFDNF